MVTAGRTYWTVGRLAEHLNEPIHRVQYAIRSRTIRPAGSAGNARVFDDEQVETIAATLREMDDRRGCR
jgi:hypothetical protein